MTQLHLSSQQMIGTIRDLEGVELPLRTLSEWAASGLVRPSISYPAKRGRYNARVYSLADAARLRLIVHLTRKGHLSLDQVRAILRDLDTDLEPLMRPAIGGRKPGVFDRVLVVRASGWSAAVMRSRDGYKILGTPQAQQLLPLGDVYEGLEEAARRNTAAA